MERPIKSTSKKDLPKRGSLLRNTTELDAVVMPAVDRERSRRGKFISRPATALIVVAVMVLLAAISVGAYLYFNQKVTTPDLIGMTQTEAQGYLDQNGFVVGDVTKRASAESAGTVIAQIPSPGEEVPDITPINIYVSAGADVTLVPEVIGLSEKLASGILYSNGIPFDIDYMLSTEASGTVIAVDPPEGTEIQPTDVVSLTVALDASNPQSLLPFDMENTTIVIDPDMSLAAASRDIPLEVANRLQGLLEASGATVSLTRTALTKQVDFTEATRTELIQNVDPQIVITLTTGKEGSAPGLQAMYLEDAQGGKATTSRTLADTLAKQLKRYTYPANAAATKTDPLGIKGTRVYNVLSLANLSVRADIARINEEGFVDNVSHALYSAIALTYELPFK